MRIFKRRTVNLSEADGGLNDQINYIRKFNAIVSESLGIGIPSQDPLENIASIDRTIHGSAARQIYRSLDIVQRIIDSPAKDALRSGFKIKTNYDDLEIDSLFYARLEELDYQDKFRDYLINARLYSRGSILFPVVRERLMDTSRKHLSTKIDFGNVEYIESLNVIPEDFLSYQTQQHDPIGRNFGSIEVMYILGNIVHPSRFKLNVLSLDIFRQRGISVLERIKPACQALNIAEWTIAQLLLRYRALILKYPGKDLLNMTDDKKKKLKAIMDKIKLNFSSKSVAAVPDSYGFEYLETKLTGINEATDFLYEYLSSVSKVPQSIIKGSARGELASAEKDQRDYYESVQSDEQEDKLRPLIQFLTPYILYERSGKINRVLTQNGVHPSTVTVEVEFNPLQSVNPIQDSQQKFIDTQRGSLDIQNGFRDADEVREELYPQLESYSKSPGISNDQDIQDFFGEDYQSLLDKISAIQTTA